MKKAARHIIKSLSSEIQIKGKPEPVWDNITDVQIAKFSDPFIFKILDIPKPLRAEVISEGTGGKRIAYFDSGMRFIQDILVWKAMTEYSFAFNPEKGFRILYFFELSEGVFRIPLGAYFLKTNGSVTVLRLSTTYSIDRTPEFFV